jgi:hypothetical protein
MPFDIYIDEKKKFENCTWVEVDECGDNLFVYGNGEDYIFKLKDKKEIKLVRCE